MSTIELSSIRRDGGTQPRAGVRSEVVDDYAEALANGDAFPPIVVFYDGTDHWLADGFHRTLAAEKAGLSIITADIRQGTRRDAILFSTGANATHGLPRTREDKWRAVQTLLTDDEWMKWSDREVGKKTGTHHSFVAKVRASLTGYKASERTYTTKHGTVSTMDTSGITKEAERKVAEAIAAKEKAEQALADKSRILTASSTNERRVITERDAARKALESAQADKARAQAGQDAAEARLTEAAAKAADEAWIEADEKYETIVNRLTRETAESKAQAERQAIELRDAVEKARFDAEKNADELAELMVKRKLETRKKEMAELDERYERVKKSCAAAHAHEERAKDSLATYEELIAKNNSEMSKWATGEAETADQVKLANMIAEVIGSAMSELLMLEHGPQPAARGKLEKASAMCHQMAQAIDEFMTRRLEVLS